MGFGDSSVFIGRRKMILIESGKVAIRVGLVALLCVVGARLASGQVTAAISGQVEDPSGSGIGGATVTVTSKETGAVRTVMSDDTGGYRVLALPVGLYDVRA